MSGGWLDIAASVSSPTSIRLLDLLPKIDAGFCTMRCGSGYSLHTCPCKRLAAQGESHEGCSLHRALREDCPTCP